MRVFEQSETETEKKICNSSAYDDVDVDIRNITIFFIKNKVITVN